MTVNGVNGISAQPAPGGAKAGEQTDPACKNLQQQIDRLQQELKEISANQEMPAETKMKKRQELQKQISELQIQLRQRQMEVKREEAEKKREANAAQNAGLPTDNMTAMISAAQSVKQANVQGSTAKKMEGKANTLEAEIKLDGSRGGDTSSKQAELSDVKAAAEKAEASQLSALAKAGKKLQEAAADERSDSQTIDENKKKDSPETNDDTEEERRDGVSDADGSAAAEAEEEAGYHPIDVRL